MSAAPEPSAPHPVDPAVLRAALAAYRPECRFVVAAWLDPGDTPTQLDAELAIPAPYYIDDTGHFNSVEFNLCAEQLLAVLLEASGRGTAANLRVERIRSAFHRAMQASRFRGTLRLVGERPDDAGGLRLEATVTFVNGTGGPSEGTIEALVARG